MDIKSPPQRLTTASRESLTASSLSLKAYKALPPPDEEGAALFITSLMSLTASASQRCKRSSAGCLQAR